MMKYKFQTILFLIYRKLVIRSFINNRLGRYYFNNDGGLISNIIGQYVRHRDMRMVNNIDFKARNNDYSEQLSSNGLVFYDSLIGSNVVDVISNKWNQFCKGKEVPSDYRLQVTSEKDGINTIKEKYVEIIEVFTDEIQDIVQQYYRCYVNLLNIHIYRITTPSKEWVKTAYGETGNWHTDGSSSESLKIFILLSDVSEKDGPMHLMNLSQTKDIIKGSNYKFASEKSNIFIEENYESTKFTGKKGKVMIVRTNDCLHRASIPEEGRTRDILTLYVTTSGIKRKQSDFLNNCNYEQFYGLKRVFLR